MAGAGGGWTQVGGRARAVLALFVVAVAALVGAGTHEHAAAETVPSISKAVAAVNPNPDTTLVVPVGYFDITVDNTGAAEPIRVTVIDAGATLISSSPNSGACTISSNGFLCRVNEKATLLLRVAKPLSLATNAPDFCTSGTLSNQASMTEFSSGNPLGTSQIAVLQVPANPGPNCTASRTVTVCKTWTDNGDGNFETGEFRGELTPSKGSGGGEWTAPNVQEAGAPVCSDFTIDADATFTLTETTFPSNWLDATGYPRYFTNADVGATCGDGSHPMSSFSTGTLAATVTRVVVCNRAKAFRQVTVCKAYLDNQDGIEAKGATFGGSLTPSSGTGASWSVANLDEGHDDCAAAITIDGDATFTLSETSLPSGWNGALGGYPLAFAGAGSCSNAAVLSGATFGSTVTRVTICNRQQAATATIRITKFDFTTGHANWTFKVAGPHVVADPVVGGGSTAGASVEISGVLLDKSSYTVAESGAKVVAECPPANTDPDLVKVTQTAGGGGIALTADGQVAQFTFVNEPCDVTGTIVVTKVGDRNGDHFQNGSDTTLTWDVTISGPSYPSGEPFTVSGTRVFSGLIAGVYTVVEAAGAPAYRTIGVVTSLAVFVPSGSTGFTLRSGGTISLTFYNQPRVNVAIQKTERRGAESGPGVGWAFTLTGCGVGPLVAITDGTGMAIFRDLPPADGCHYTVTEEARLDWVAVSGHQQTAAPTAAGETVRLRFTNVLFVVSDGPVPQPPLISAPTATPTPTATTRPRETPTAGPPRESPAPGLVADVGPSSTPPPGVAVAVVIPKPPATGSGTASGDGIWFEGIVVLAGLAAALGEALLSWRERRKA